MDGKMDYIDVKAERLSLIQKILERSLIGEEFVLVNFKL